MWNKDAVIDFLDISVVDQFNQLVPLPSFLQIDLPTTNKKVTGSWPDFQITLLATEN
jgi:hypothetical protein